MLALAPHQGHSGMRFERSGSCMRTEDHGSWRDMASAPRDGTRVLVAVRESEQGPAEVDVVRWAKPERSAEECWIAVDSDPGCVIAYEEAELSSWMPLPTPLPKLRSTRFVAAPLASQKRGNHEEMGGSGI